MFLRLLKHVTDVLKTCYHFIFPQAVCKNIHFYLLWDFIPISFVLICVNMLYLYLFSILHSTHFQPHDHTHTHTQFVVFFNLIETNVKFISEA